MSAWETLICVISATGNISEKPNSSGIAQRDSFHRTHAPAIASPATGLVNRTTAMTRSSPAHRQVVEGDRRNKNQIGHRNEWQRLTHGAHVFPHTALSIGIHRCLHEEMRFQRLRPSRSGTVPDGVPEMRWAVTKNANDTGDSHLVLIHGRTFFLNSFPQFLDDCTELKLLSEERLRR